MSLLLDQFEPCVMLDKMTNVPDGFGGQKTAYVPGLQFNAFIRLDNNLDEKIAQKELGISFATIVTPYDLDLKVNDVVKRISDSKIFRVTSDSDDFKVPAIASARMKVKKATAEEWKLPD